MLRRAFSLSVFAACRHRRRAARAAQDKTITVFAAASMKNALDDVNAAFTKATGIKVVASYAASLGAGQADRAGRAGRRVRLRRSRMDGLSSQQKKLIKTDTRVNLLGNRLVLIAPKDSKLGNVTIGQGFDLAKLAGDGRIATGDVRAVPAGKYAKAALEKLGAWAAAEPKLAMAENVRAALALVGARRGAARHRLRDRRQGRAEREDRRPLPGRLASADRLSGGADGERQARGGAVSRHSCASGPAQVDLRDTTASPSWCKPVRT